MAYLERPAQTGRCPVPVKPILDVVERWLSEEAERSGWRPAGRNNGQASPLQKLAGRAGMKEASCARAVSRFRNETQHMTLELADKFVNATYGDELWDTPELHPYKPKPVRDFTKTWMRPDEKESPRDWARRVAKGMSSAQLREIVASLDVDALRDVDDSTFARPPRPKQMNHLALMKTTPAFFGEIKGRREEEAA